MKTPQEALPMLSINVERERCHVDEEKDETRQNKDGEDEWRQQPFDPQHVVQVDVGRQGIEPGARGVDQLLAELLQGGHYLILGYTVLQIYSIVKANSDKAFRKC